MEGVPATALLNRGPTLRLATMPVLHARIGGRLGLAGRIVDLTEFGTVTSSTQDHANNQ